MAKPMVEARQEVSRQEILQAATRLFAERGVRGTSLAEIAEALGVTKAALYYYFPSKQDIVIEAVRSNEREFMADTMAPLPEDLPAAEVLRARVERKLARVERNGPLELRFFYAVMLEELDEPQVERVYREFWERVQAEGTKIIQQGRRRGDFRSDVDVRTALNVFQATAMGIDILWLNDPERVDLRRCYEMALAQLLCVLQAPSRPARGNGPRSRNPGRRAGRG